MSAGDQLHQGRARAVAGTGSQPPRLVSQLLPVCPPRPTPAEGLEVVAAITKVPTFTPNDNARAFNDFAQFIGDERAAKTRAKWGRPLQAVVITRAGLL